MSKFTPPFRRVDTAKGHHSYEEVARTIGRQAKAIRKRFPGRGWTRQQCMEYTHAIRRCTLSEYSR